MPAISLIAIFPLLLSLVLGPGLLRSAPPPPSARAGAARPDPSAPVWLASPPSDADIPWLGRVAPPAETEGDPGPHTVADPAAVAVSEPSAPSFTLGPLTLPSPSLPLLGEIGGAARVVLPAAPAAPKSGILAPILSLLSPPRLVSRAGGPVNVTAEQIVDLANALMGVRYLWGGNSAAGMDCSAFVSRVWNVARRTTETLPGVAFRIDKEELLPGDILNLTMSQDPRGYGHVRLFAGWANDSHTRMWVFEETPPRAIHHVIAYDPRYTPLRRINYAPGDLTSPHLMSLLAPAGSTALPSSQPADSPAENDGEDVNEAPPAAAADLTGAAGLHVPMSTAATLADVSSVQPWTRPAAFRQSPTGASSELVFDDAPSPSPPPSHGASTHRRSAPAFTQPTPIPSPAPPDPAALIRSSSSSIRPQATPMPIVWIEQPDLHQPWARPSSTASPPAPARSTRPIASSSAAASTRSVAPRAPASIPTLRSASPSAQASAAASADGRRLESAPQPATRRRGR